MMHIDEYRFGHIDIGGRGYAADVRIAPTGEAVEEFNRLQRDCARIVAARLLTG